MQKNLPNWRPALEKPDSNKPLAALVAVRNPETLGWNLAGTYIWRATIGWRHERKSTPLPTSDFVWLPQNELLATI